MPSSQGRLSSETYGDTTIVAVNGDLDMTARSEGEAMVRQVEAQKVDDLIVDLAGLGFLDSTGCATLLALAHAVRERSGRARLRNADARANFLLETCGYRELFELVHTDETNSQSVDAAAHWTIRH